MVVDICLFVCFVGLCGWLTLKAPLEVCVFCWVLRDVGMPGLLVAYGSCSWTVNLSSEPTYFKDGFFNNYFFCWCWLVAFIFLYRSFSSFVCMFLLRI
jgi:hypothetical protein